MSTMPFLTAILGAIIGSILANHYHCSGLVYLVLMVVGYFLGLIGGAFVFHVEKTGPYI